MSAPRIYGWCPGALRPMRSGDGLVVRVRPPMGRLSVRQAQGLAALAAQHGNGRIDLTARANLQLRGVAENTHLPLIEGLRDLELIDPDIATETRRNLMIQPFWRNGDTTGAVASALDTALKAADAPDLPGKFGFAIDCGCRPVLADGSADIRIERAAEGLICRPDGAETGIPTDADSAAATAMALARWFLDTGGAPEGRGRMAAHIARRGLPDGCHMPAPKPAPPPVVGPVERGFLAGLEFGQIRADALSALAANGPLRLTPWRMFLVEGLQQPALPAGLIDHPEDPRLNISACTGAPGCPQAQAETRPLARALARQHGALAGHLHVSGCAKGCAHPGPARHTLVARAADRFDLIQNGRASDLPARRDLSSTDLLSGEL